ncbi:hypothetical protein [Nocardia abscessus]|uniref:hypothetical protein n=1 Tax=Nocardia abscessus TaxID=120957 RepID=UPI002453D918|nr:hypothetical protein [Nocardia abscessus]
MSEPFVLTTPSGLITVTVRPWTDEQRDTVIREIRQIVDSLTQAYLRPTGGTFTVRAFGQTATLPGDATHEQIDSALAELHERAQQGTEPS